MATTLIDKQTGAAATGLTDPYGRTVTYLRLSVTDRCDLRCTYCMPQKMTFLPKRDVLTLEELSQLASEFIDKGVKKIRITGGEPLVRKDVVDLIEYLSAHLKTGALSELTLTTNGTRLEQFAGRLAAAGIKRINVSMDSLIPETYSRITRGGDIEKVLRGITTAQAAGIRIKINCVALKGDNVDEIRDMIAWAHANEMDFTLIEAMPMGEISEDRFDQFVPLNLVKSRLESVWTLRPNLKRTGGPARYFDVLETGGEIGFITPMSHNFCGSCNRVRLTCTGQLYMCLGQSAASDLRAVLRGERDVSLSDAIDEAIGRKPEAHDFNIDRRGQAPATPRHMSTTGG